MIFFALDEAIGHKPKANDETEKAEDSVGRVLRTETFEDIFEPIRIASVVEVAALETFELSSNSLQP